MEGLEEIRVNKADNERILDIIEQETIEAAREEYMEMERLYLDGGLEI